jgi:hypothetical protein
MLDFPAKKISQIIVASASFITIYNFPLWLTYLIQIEFSFGSFGASFARSKSNYFSPTSKICVIGINQQNKAIVTVVTNPCPKNLLGEEENTQSINSLHN